MNNSAIKQTPNKKNCSYCLKDISYKKIILHERLCRNIMTKCSHCNDIIPIEELEEHIEEYHHSSLNTHNNTTTNIICSDRKLRSYMKKSIRKPIPCKYCGLNFLCDDTHNELEEHEYFCGSKTEECTLCKQMIPKKFYDEHITTQCPNRQSFTIKKAKVSKRDILMSNEVLHSTQSKNYSNIRRRLLSLDKELIKRKNSSSKKGFLTNPPFIIKRKLFNIEKNKKRKKKEERNATLDMYLTKKQARASSAKKEL